MGLISTTALAAHQIALQIAAILFMVPFGIGMAATVRVGHAVGRSDARGGQARGLCRDAARHRVHAAHDAGRDLRPVCDRADFPRRGRRGAGALDSPRRCCWSARPSLSPTASRPSRPASLRGMNDTRVPLLFAAISYWLIGFPCACALGFRTPLARSASGSGCRSGPRSMPPFCSCASACWRAGSHSRDRLTHKRCSPARNS